ncbi:MAG: TolC family protein [Ghiorsea sp.]|nr:TolC family protein [Ghiorsea sp.]
MKIRYITTCMLLSILPWAAHATTLEQAMNMVKEKHPKLAMSALDNDAARAQLSSQSSYAYNPELSLEYQDRKLNGGGNSADYYIGISQGIELGGKRGYREEAAQAALQQSKDNTEVLRQQLSIAVARSYVELSLAKQTLDVRIQQSQALKALSAGVKRQLDVGDANILDANLAQSAYITALSAETNARQMHALLQARYQNALGKNISDDTDFVLPQLQLDWQIPENPLVIAKSSRAEMTALKAKVRQFQAKSELADANRFSDPTISLMKGREAGEDLVKLGVSFALPLTNTRKGTYQASLAQAMRSQNELTWFEQRLALDVQTAVFNHAYAMQALKEANRMAQSMNTDHNVKLAKAAFDAGELSLEDLVIHINQALEARLTRLNIIKQGWLARIRLAEVLGHPEYITQGIQS